MTDNKNMTEIPRQKKIRLFASFQNENHQRNAFDALIKKIPTSLQMELTMYLGMMDSTIAEGYADGDNN